VNGCKVSPPDGQLPREVTARITIEDGAWSATL
jgi:hypothetical protein